MVRPKRAFKFLMSRGLLLGVAMHLALFGWMNALAGAGSAYWRTLKDEPALSQGREHAYSEPADKHCNLSVGVDHCQAVVRVSVRKCPDTMLGDCFGRIDDKLLALHLKTM